MKELCRANNARAYIIVQPKDNFECLLNVGKKILDAIQNKNYSIKPEHLIRQAYCENHKTRKKQWVLDLDNDSMDETWLEDTNGAKELKVHRWTLEEVQSLVKTHLLDIGKNEDDMYTVKTPHGHHIVTSPFNLQNACKECSLLFEGVQKKPVDANGNLAQKVGWLHKDGMTILYAETQK